MSIKRYFLIQKKINNRKKELEDIFRYMYYGINYDLGAEYATDDILTKLYIQLEECLEPRGYKKQWVKHNGIWKTLFELSEESVVSYDVLRSRILYLGWPLEKAMNTPKKQWKKISTEATTFLQEFFKTVKYR